MWKTKAPWDTVWVCESVKSDKADKIASGCDEKSDVEWFGLGDTIAESITTLMMCPMDLTTCPLGQNG